MIILEFLILFIYFIPHKTLFTNEAKIIELNVMSKTIIHPTLVNQHNNKIALL